VRLDCYASRGSTLEPTIMCECGTVLEAVPDDSHTVGCVRYTCPRCPDIRSVTELTPERLEAWTGHWAIEVDPPTLGRRWQCCPSIEVGWWQESSVPILGCYPCRRRKPWRPAPWAEVDQEVKS